MVNRLIIANILHRPIRTIVSALAVAIEVAMVILVVGLCHGMVNDSARRVEGVGADILVRPPGSSFIMGMGESPMPIKYWRPTSRIAARVGGGARLDSRQLRRVAGPHLWH